jgi:hypothetical protein
MKRSIVVDNSLSRYGQHVCAALHELADRQEAQSAKEFTPRHGLPQEDARLAQLFAHSDLAFHELEPYEGKKLTLLDLMRNPNTRTTKTYASLIIVARAVEHIRQTGERIMIVTPSSGNKVTALRDAVLQAIQVGLVCADQLQILSVVPHSSRPKLWSSPLDQEPDLAVRNPLATYAGSEPGDVKALAREFVNQHAEDFWQRRRVRLWHTMDIENYKAADVIRAHAEDEFLPASPRPRLHVHAVSSAFGLLGHDLGARQLATVGRGGPNAQYFLVQHLGTPDMVLSLHFGEPSRRNLPEYHFDAATGLLRQESDPHFPATTYSVDEVLDSTFYTHRPVTSAQMDPLIQSRGGGGIVVSLHECLSRYGQVRGMVQPADIDLPDDPRDLREWSLVMALTGVLNAIDRGLVSVDDIVIHGTGSYTTADFQPVPEQRLIPVVGVDDLVQLAEKATVEAVEGT